MGEPGHVLRPGCRTSIMRRNLGGSRPLVRSVRSYREALGFLQDVTVLRRSFPRRQANGEGSSLEGGRHRWVVR